MNKTTIAFVVLFILAGVFRTADALRPLDQASWRESDIGSIARNFVREGMDPLEPRIDWRGSGPGIAEMEFPAYPFLIALSYEIFGIHDVLARLWSLVFSLVTLVLFFKLASEYLSGAALVIATAFFAFGPLPVETATSAQPEGLMMLFYIAAVLYFTRWLRDENRRDLVIAAVATSLAILAKATAAHIGLLFGILLFEKFGWTLFRQLRIWLFGIIALLPGAAWYLYSKSLWLTYGNSLGVSNEYHWIGPDFFTNPYFVTGILRNELIHVWLFVGIIPAIVAVFYGRRERYTRVALYWFTSVFILFLVAARTTADEWASYYHVFSVAPAALLFGGGIDSLWKFLRRSADTFSSRRLSGNLLRLSFGLAILLCTAMTFALIARSARAAFLTKRHADPAFASAAAIKPALSGQGLILVSGGNCRDEDGYALAYNASYMFYWLDRKGWNICIEQQSISGVKEYARLGARYFIAQSSAVEQVPGFEAQLESTFPMVIETPDFMVFDLR